jgi:hypothetical protein
MNTKGIVTPIPIFAWDESPPDEFVGEGFGLEVELEVKLNVVDVAEVEGPGASEPELMAITSVMAADFWSVKVDVYRAAPEGIVVVTKNVVKTAVSWAMSTTVTVPSLTSCVIT